MCFSITPLTHWSDRGIWVCTISKGQEYYLLVHPEVEWNPRLVEVLTSHVEGTESYLNQNERLLCASSDTPEGECEEGDALKSSM